MAKNQQINASDEGSTSDGASSNAGSSSTPTSSNDIPYVPPRDRTNLTRVEANWENKQKTDLEGGEY